MRSIPTGQTSFPLVKLSEPPGSGPVLRLHTLGQANQGAASFFKAGQHAQQGPRGRGARSLVCRTACTTKPKRPGSRLIPCEPDSWTAKSTKRAMSSWADKQLRRLSGSYRAAGPRSWAELWHPYLAVDHLCRGADLSCSLPSNGIASPCVCQAAKTPAGPHSIGMSSELRAEL
ncbi:hypothetical protein Droror1_Dr00013746 [Drosera rotundifolia]